MRRSRMPRSPARSPFPPSTTGAAVANTDRNAVRLLLERYFRALNEGNADAVAACVAPAFLNEHTATLGANLRGRDAYRERLRGFLASFIDLHYEPEAMIIDGDRAAVPYTFSGRWRGSEGEYPEGRPFSIRGIFTFRIADAELVHRVDYWDSAEFLRQVEEGVAG
jgi:steroid delta-isomerase-like uncharacterized protein